MLLVFSFLHDSTHPLGLNPQLKHCGKAEQAWAGQSRPEQDRRDKEGKRGTKRTKILECDNFPGQKHESIMRTVTFILVLSEQSLLPA